MDSIIDQLKTQIQTREDHCKEATTSQRVLRIREVYYGKLFNILKANGLI